MLPEKHIPLHIIFPFGLNVKPNSFELIDAHGDEANSEESGQVLLDVPIYQVSWLPPAIHLAVFFGQPEFQAGGAARLSSDEFSG
jgi:hypothetical protein